ncbi:MAG: ABC transporter ATP-binding protein, partial [Planctomycetaceae bacterium]|nr:ABC transporter ATP-binding protein [Planctomycetaceae bacterium]
MIQAENLRRRHVIGSTEVHALAGVTLRIVAGERVAIVGRSGSGKSTLLNLLSGVDRPDEGVLIVANQRLDQLSRSEMASYRLHTVGIVFQSFQLIPHRTAFQNVELPLILAGVPPAERRERVAMWLDRVGLTQRQHHRPTQMSGGEQQRTGIARALINSPRLLLADEPTGNL